MTPEALAALCARAYRHMRPWTAAAFAGTLSDPDALLVADDHAFVLGRLAGDEVEILALATDPAHQRRGAASDALRRFERGCAERAVTRILLEVAAPNTAARGFYASRGYAEIGRRKGYYRHANGARSDAVVMARTLTQGHEADGPAGPAQAGKSG